MKIRPLEWRKEETSWVATNPIGYFTVNCIHDYLWSFGFTVDPQATPTMVNGIVDEIEAKRFADTLYQDMAEALIKDIKAKAATWVRTQLQGIIQ